MPERNSAFALPSEDYHQADAAHLETLQRYCAQHGIVRKERTLEELFIDAGRVSIPEEV